MNTLQTLEEPTRATSSNQPLAILGGPKTVPAPHPDLFHWPIVTEEDERAVVAVLRAGNMSGTNITREFEKEYAAWQGTRYALAWCNGTAALLGAMYGVGMGRGDEIICPSVTCWASAMQAMLLGATPVFADIEPVSLCLDPNDIEKRISKRTRAIMVVHYCGHPADMDPILNIARRHGLKVIEDGSHAHGALYRGRKTGAIGDVAGLSMMAGKSFAIGEGGMLCTNDREIYERAVALAHYERGKTDLTIPPLRALAAADGFRPDRGRPDRRPRTAHSIHHSLSFQPETDSARLPPLGGGQRRQPGDLPRGTRRPESFRGPLFGALDPRLVAKRNFQVFDPLDFLAEVYHVSRGTRHARQGAE